MPRHNTNPRRQRRHRPTPDPTPETSERETYEQAAHRLVNAGVCPPTILGVSTARPNPSYPTDPGTPVQPRSNNPEGKASA